MKNCLKCVIVLIFSFNASLIHLKAQSKTVLVGLSVNKYWFNRQNYKINDSISIKGIGFTVGFAYEVPIYKKVSALLGFGFYQRKNETKYISWPNSDKSNYATFPLAINYYIFNNLALQAGIQFDHLIFKQKFVYYSDSLQQHSGYTKYDIGINSGLRFKFQILEVNVSYNIGLINVTNSYYPEPLTGKPLVGSAKSSMIRIGISYLFR
ncbi:MAG: outer membrane beta-barrel protein [Saprospiraceae bacterium]